MVKETPASASGGGAGVFTEITAKGLRAPGAAVGMHVEKHEGVGVLDVALTFLLLFCKRYHGSVIHTGGRI